MAVYTNIVEKDLINLIKKYDIGTLLSYTGILSGVENTNFLLNTTQGTYILTLYEKRININYLPFYINLMQYLNTKGLPCPRPIDDQNHHFIHTICNKSSLITSFLKGESPLYIDVSHCQKIGELLAYMHIATEKFSMSLPNTLGINKWRTIFHQCQEHIDQIKPGLTTIINDELNFLQENWPYELLKGVIHADLFPDNVFFLEKEKKISGLIDFYFSCNDLLAYDVAICMNAWCFEENNIFNEKKSKILLSAYNSIRNFSHKERITLPILSRGACLRFLLTRLYDFIYTPKNSLVIPKNPYEYIEKLHFHQNVSDTSVYGLI